jgi:hypothetical protein
MATSVPPMQDPMMPPPAGLSQIERVVDTFVAPSKTFADIRRSAAWWLPFVLIVLLSYCFTFALQSHIGWQRATTNMMNADPAAQARLDKLPPDQKQRQMTAIVGFTRVISFAYPIVILLSALIVAGVMMLSFNVGLGAHANYGRYLAVWLYSSLVLMLKAVLTIVLMFVGDPDNFNIKDPIGSNLGYYLSANSIPAWLHSLLSSLDIFAIWTAVVLTIGFSIVCNVSRKAAAGVVFGWWGLIVLLGVGWAAIFG